MTFDMSRRTLLAAAGLVLLPGYTATAGDGIIPGVDGYAFTTNRCRLATRYASISDDVLQASAIYLGVAEIETYSYRLAFSIFSNDTSGRYPTELNDGGPFEIAKISIGYGESPDITKAVWLDGTFLGEPGVLMEKGGVELVLSDDLVPQNAPIPPRWHRWALVQVRAFKNSRLPVSYRFAPDQDFEGVRNSGANGEPTEAGIVASSIKKNARPSAGFGPAYIISKGEQKRPSFLIWGDSIGFGENEGPETYDKGIFGFIARGLEMSDGGERMFGGNFCVPGSRPSDWTSFGRAAVEKKLALLRLSPNLPFTHIISEHGTNSAGVWNEGQQFENGMRAYARLLRTEFPGCPIIQTTLFPKARSIDGYRTNTGQKPLTGFDANDFIDKFNSDLINGRYSESFDYYCDPSSLVSASAGRWLVSDFQTTLHSDYTEGQELLTSEPPPADQGLVLHGKDSDSFEARHILKITGSGPFSVLVSKPFSSSYKAGSLATGAYNVDTTHPEAAAHKIAARAINRIKLSLN